MTPRSGPAKPSRPGAPPRPPAAPPVSRWRRPRRWLFLLACGLLGVNVIMGDRVSIYTPRLHGEAAREHQRLEREIAELRRDNRRMREQARGLREDPAAIEAVARRDLGLIRPGEILFLLSDGSPARRRDAR